MKLFNYADTQLSSQNMGLAPVVNLTLIVCFLFLALHRPATAQTVDIPDPGLRAVIEAALGKEAGVDITQSEMKSLESLQANRCRFLTLSEKGWFTPVAERWICESTDDTYVSSIQDLTGLEFATNLIELELSRNQISDVSPLKDLINLTHLSLINNRVSDVSPLKNLTNLRELDLLDNRVSDVSPLKNLTNLTHLSLRSNQISDISPLKNLTNLTYISLRDNQISDVSPLKNLTNLIQLNLLDNRVSDVSPLKDMTNLKHLDLDDNAISDVSPLKDMTNLIHLDISDNAISDVSPLKDMTNLTGLDLDSNGIVDIFSLKYLTNLTTLDLAHNEISDLSALKTLAKLRRLELDDNRISHLFPLNGLTDLTELDLDGNRISDVTPLKGLTKLTVLHLSDNQISDFSPLAGVIENLVEYDASNQTEPLTKVEDVNRDGIVDAADLILVALNYRNPDFANSAQFDIYPDVNGDSVVDVRDLVAVAAEIDAASAAPALMKKTAETTPFTVGNLLKWILLAKQLEVQEPRIQKGITVLEQLLAALTFKVVPPKETALLANYPNPFNPETWIPYQLARSADVNITIHSGNGQLVRVFVLGHLPAGVYSSKSRAAYWDGRNELGESVASGVYFYTLTAGDFTATGKMLIRK